MFPISKVLKNQLKLLKTSLPILDSRIWDRELWIEGTVYIILGNTSHTKAEIYN